jgi:hypothetical protein
VISFSFNGSEVDIQTVEALGQALDKFDESNQFELCASTTAGASITMLRNGNHAFIMKMRFSGDSGLTSVGQESAEGSITYQLSNGQYDEYPVSWCIDKEQCYKAIAYFLVNDGDFPEWIRWRES